MMRKQVVITTPFPTAEDLAETYGISKTRLRRLKALAKEISGNGSKEARNSPTTRVKRKRKASSRA
jgi:hypothetical protein